MSNAFGCPQCGAALEYDGSGRTMRCPYCSSHVEVPEEFWRPVEETRTARQWQKYVVLFLVVTVGLPTCLGLLGTVLGIGGGVFAAILPFVLRIFVR